MSEETVEVTVKVNKGFLQFLKDIIPSTEYENVDEYLEDAVISRVRSDIEGDIFNPKLEEVTKKYKLEGVFCS